MNFNKYALGLLILLSASHVGFCALKADSETDKSIKDEYKETKKAEKKAQLELQNEQLGNLEKQIKSKYKDVLSNLYNHGRKAAECYKSINNTLIKPYRTEKSSTLFGNKGWEIKDEYGRLSEKYTSNDYYLSEIVNLDAADKITFVKLMKDSEFMNSTPIASQWDRSNDFCKNYIHTVRKWVVGEERNYIMNKSGSGEYNGSSFVNGLTRKAYLINEYNKILDIKDETLSTIDSIPHKTFAVCIDEFRNDTINYCTNDKNKSYVDLAQKISTKIDDARYDGNNKDLLLLTSEQKKEIVEVAKSRSIMQNKSA